MSDKNELDLIEEVITKSEDDFEKKITYIGAGALLLSLTLLDKIIKFEVSSGIGYLIAGWIVLIISLLTNLLSHLVSKIQLRKAQQEVRDKVKFDIRLSDYKKGICKI